MITINVMAAAGVVLACAAMIGTFFAGSDMARIGGHWRPMIAASTSLLIAALMLEYHA